jgi:hypothetical protein
VLRVHPAVPADAAVVATLRTAPSLLAALHRFPLMSPISETQLAELRAELDSYLSKRLGLALADTSGFTLFALRDSDHLALVVEGATGVPRAPVWKDHHGIQVHQFEGEDWVWSALDDAIVVGHPEAVLAALDTAAARRERWAGGESVAARLVESESSAASIIVAIQRDRLGAPARLATEAWAVDAAVLTFGPRGLRLVAEGEPAVIEPLAQQVAMALSAARQEADAAREAAKQSDDVPRAIGLIVAANAMMRLERELRPVVQGRRLEVTLPTTTEDAEVAVAGAGVLAAVAIPAFTKYLRRAKTSEARLTLESIVAAVEARVADDGGCRGLLGRGTHVTPPLELACHAGEGGRCHPGAVDKAGGYDAGEWGQAGWVALGIRLDEPHVFHYELAVESTGAAKRGGCEVQVRARGDLDADGVYSTFERRLRVTGRDVQRDDTLRVDEELE